MPVKQFIMPDIQVGDPIQASWLNKLKNGNITASPPVTVTQQAGNYNIALDPLSKDWFIGKVTSDIGSDAVYYVNRRRIKSGSSDAVGFILSDLHSVLFPSDNYRVVNLPELQKAPSDSTNLLPMNTPVVVFCTQDDSHPWKKKYVMIANPPAMLPVKVKQSDGVAGDSDTTCTFTYTVKSLGGTILGTAMSPLWPRFSDTTYVAPASDSYGVAFYDTGVLKLWQTLEHPAQSDCD